MEPGHTRLIHGRAALVEPNRRSPQRFTLSLAAEVEGEAIDASDAEVSDDPLVARYHLAAIAPIGPADRYRLLAAPGPMERIRLLDEVLDDVDAMLKFRLS